MGQKAADAFAVSVGFTQGGPAGAIAAKEGSKAVRGAGSWLKTRKLLAKPSQLKSIGSPAAGAIGAVNATSLLFPSLQEQDHRQ